MVRKIRQGDLIEVLALYEQWTAEQTQYRGHWESHEGLGVDFGGRFNEAIESPDSLGIVFDDGSALNGAALARLVRLTDGPGDKSMCRIDWLFVRGDRRMVGVASGLLAAAESWARESGALGIEMGVLPGNRDAKNFCEHNRLKARLLVMAKRWDQT